MPLTDHFEIAQRTHPGKVRSHNEDSISASPGLGIAVLADGMGGYNAGEIASGMATVLLRSSLEADLLNDPSVTADRVKLHALLEARVADANRAIFQSAQNRTDYAGMGTTLVLALFHDNIVTTAHIGDSRMYRLRDAELTQVTRDHSLLQEQIDAGILTIEQARYSQNKNLVTRALGVEAQVVTEIADYETREGDLYLLCSDGLSDMVSDEDMRDLLVTPGGDLEATVESLVNRANENGGRDNVSVILVKVNCRRNGSGNILMRFMNWLK